MSTLFTSVLACNNYSILKQLLHLVHLKQYSLNFTTLGTWVTQF